VRRKEVIGESKRKWQGATGRGENTREEEKARSNMKRRKGKGEN